MGSILNPTTNRTLRHEQMLELLVDLTGGCIEHPSNDDVLKAVLEQGLTDAQTLALMAHSIQHTRTGTQPGPFTERLCAKALNAFIKNRIVRARMIRHSSKYHGVPRVRAKECLRELGEDCEAVLRLHGELCWGES